MDVSTRSAILNDTVLRINILQDLFKSAETLIETCAASEGSL